MGKEEKALIVAEEIDEDGKQLGFESELDDEDESQIEIEKPFDPEKIKVLRETKTISLLSTRMGHKEIDLAPDFQRLPGIWDDIRKSRLIESILLRIPLPVFYVASDSQDNWAVVDGLQRLTTIQDFLKGRLRLARLEYLTQFNGCCFTDLPRSMQRRIEETELVVNVIQPGTPEEVMFNIFSRINTGGLTLNGQEIRHALNKGRARSFLKELAKSKAFLQATQSSLSDKRMAARECVLRFLAFWMTNWSEYSSNDLDGFLNAAMKRLNNSSEETLNLYREKFEKSMKVAGIIFGKHAFRKRYAIGANRNPISKALFEAWAVSFAHRSDAEHLKLIENKDLVNTLFIELMNDNRDFEVAISYSTGSPKRVHERFEAIEGIIETVLQNE